ncbi:TauD/TfdA family dioxygenase [Lentzea sp. BCCO 10_0061]|uniref:TauD/TfdA family dioxygenase n=1 Tax=Lentzea sokolovensis TaxID=3095429 RepID=A0ABU4URC7_9PSEU|nr:TauD/TfdA family dioxygenase [Lentzea sp. BCCO 10_0061]MDX8141363.1 TauD/TfdA family dioxygenase [Lentzea sp. BCCO 10_0061]
MSITTAPLSPHIGLEVGNLDHERDFDESTRQALLEAWIRGGILLFRGCRSAEAHLRLSRCFGQLESSATPDLNVDGNPYLMELKYDPENGKGPGGMVRVNGVDRAGWLGWHWDQSFMPVIARGAALRMIEPAATAGETGFIDGIAAWERLPVQLQERIEHLEVVYDFSPEMDKNPYGFPTDLVNLKNDPESIAELHKYNFPPVVHPLVITHPETGRKVLKLSPLHANRVLGLGAAQSDALLHQLADHLVDERYAYFHKWSEDDVLVWDNWRVIHCAAGVPLDVRRRAQRTTLLGDYGHGRYLDPALGRKLRTATIAD